MRCCYIAFSTAPRARIVERRGRSRLTVGGELCGPGRTSRCCAPAPHIVFAVVEIAIACRTDRPLRRSRYRNDSRQGSPAGATANFDLPDKGVRPWNSLGLKAHLSGLKRRDISGLWLPRPGYPAYIRSIRLMSF